MHVACFIFSSPKTLVYYTNIFSAQFLLLIKPVWIMHNFTKKCICFQKIIIITMQSTIICTDIGRFLPKKFSNFIISSFFTHQSSGLIIPLIYIFFFKACSQIQHGILALFGPSDLLLGTHVQSLCDALDIPHLEARWVYLQIFFYIICTI